MTGFGDGSDFSWTICKQSALRSNTSSVMRQVKWTAMEHGVKREVTLCDHWLAIAERCQWAAALATAQRPASNDRVVMYQCAAQSSAGPGGDTHSRSRPLNAVVLPFNYCCAVYSTARASVGVRPTLRYSTSVDSLALQS